MRAAGRPPAPRRISIRYEQGRLPGRLFLAGPGPRPLVMIDRDSHSPGSDAWAHGGAAAHAAGFHWMTFDGPGSVSLGRPEAHLRPDWEAVLSAVLDALRGHEQVDQRRIGLIATGSAAFGAARALPRERRFAAAVLMPGIVDLSVPFVRALPPAAGDALLYGDREGFARELHLLELFTPGASDRLRSLVRGFGPERAPLFDLYGSVLRFRLGSQPEPVSTPVLVCRRPGERRWPGQAERLLTLLDGPVAQIAARAGDGRIAAWLRRVL